MDKKYEDWPLTNIKAELKKRGKKQSGRKKELIER